MYGKMCIILLFLFVFTLKRTCFSILLFLFVCIFSITRYNKRNEKPQFILKSPAISMLSVDIEKVFLGGFLLVDQGMLFS